MVSSEGVLDADGPPREGTVVAVVDGAFDAVGSGNAVGPPEDGAIVKEGPVETVGACMEGIFVMPPPVVGAAVTPDGALDAVGPASDGIRVSTEAGAADTGALLSTVGTKTPVVGLLVALVGSLEGTTGTIGVGTVIVGRLGPVPRLGKLVVKRDGSRLGAGDGPVGAGLIVISISSGGKSCR